MFPPRPFVAIAALGCARNRPRSAAAARHGLGSQLPGATRAQTNEDELAARKRQKLLAKSECSVLPPHTCTLELQLTTSFMVSGKLSFEEVTDDPLAQQQMIVSIEHGRPKTSLQHIREKLTKRFGGAPASQPSATCSMPRAACRMPRATCSMPRAACHMQRATCSVRHCLTKFLPSLLATLSISRPV